MEKSENDLSLTSRAYAREKDFVLASAVTYNLTGNYPQRYDFLLGQIKPQVDLFVRHYSTAKNSFQVGRIVADVIYKRNKTENYGFEVEFDGTRLIPIARQAAAVCRGRGVQERERVPAQGQVQPQQVGLAAVREGQGR